MAAYNGTEIVQNGLVLLLDAANPKSYNVGIATTAWNDISGRGNNGSLIGGVGYEDKNGGILRFDGVNDNVQMGNASNFISVFQSSITINSWIKTNIIGSYKKIFYTGPAGSQSIAGLYLSIGPSPYETYFGVKTDSSEQAAIYRTNISTTQYSNLCGTYDGFNIKLYLNGTLVAIQPQAGNIVNTGIARISGYDNNNETWNGNIAQVSIYNRALAAEEVLQNYNALKSRFVQPSPKVVDDGLILYLDAADVDSYPAFGTIWTDLSGRGNNGTLDNGVGYSNEFGGALTFDGVNDSVTIADNFDFRNTFPSGNFTITSVSKSTDATTYPKSSHPFWIQTYVLNNAGAIANKGMSSADGSNATSFGIEVNDGGNYFIGYINHIVNVSTVYHRSFVVDRSNGFALRYYVNGNLLGEIKSVSVTGTIYTTGGMSFGNMYGWMFNGSLYRLSVHSKALTSTEVLQNYNAVKGKFGI